MTGIGDSYKGGELTLAAGYLKPFVVSRQGMACQ